MEDAEDSVSPVLALKVLPSGISRKYLTIAKVFRNCYPQFAEENVEGFVQQDAEECWSHFIHAFENNLPGYDLKGEMDTSTRLIEQFMTGSLLNEFECLDAPEEEHVKEITSFNKLAVNIGSGSHTHMLSDLTAVSVMLFT